ncbi:aspartate kinase [Vibrio ostreicida]|uniref:Aspartokinase n=1 Tax=Vibrio ostreicida TaxID=526588 RepID=A0ABT8BP76_9VIBR|nr:aspartate kinase [Vibrio ostreicida]MDN3608239.1 aspartate kinase [Vibrio ostreicida]NPD09775.1 aspartate kinase [Vibrio ostreicida]
MKNTLIVQKFGGTSVGSIEKIHKVAEHIIKEKNDGNQVVVVVSAMSGETNRLMGLAKQIDGVPSARELDVLLSAGEQVSMALLAMTLNKQGHVARSLTGAQAKIVTDNLHNDATIKHIDTSIIKAELAQDHIVIVAGFQGINDAGDITTLGRGGSDTTAVVLAGALQAGECQIFTDVDGIYTCDPRIVPSAKRVDVIDFISMEEMASKGAKVLHLPSVQYAAQHGIPLRVLSTFEGDGGSLVQGQECQKNICGIAVEREMIMIQVDHNALSNLEKKCRMIGVLICSVIEHPEWTGVVIKADVYAKLNLVFGEKIRNSEPVSLLTVIGLKVEGLVEQSYALLSEQGINVVHAALKPQSLMLILLPEYIDKAANILHDAYIISEQAFDGQQKYAVLS